jgi:hypothetical protein
VHHQDRNPKNNDHDNLVALCIDCHAKEHGKDKLTLEIGFLYGVDCRKKKSMR